jgi:hypothetical protein
MKKTLLLSVVASTMIMAGGDIAPVEPVVEAPVVSGWEFSGNGKVYYQTSDDGANLSGLRFDGETGNLFDQKQSAADAGIQLRATNNDVFAGIGAGVAVNGLATLNLENYMVSNVAQGTGNVAALGNGNDIDDVTDGGWIAEAYLTYGFGNTGIKAGRQTLPESLSPFAYSENWNVFANTFDAVTVVNTALSNTTIVAGWIAGGNYNAFGAQNSNLTDFNSLNGSDGVWMITAQNKSISNLTLTASYYYGANMTPNDDLSIIWGDAAYDAESFGVAIQGGQADAGSLFIDQTEDVGAFGAKLTGKLAGFSLMGAYSTVSDGRMGQLGGTTSVLYTNTIIDQLVPREVDGEDKFVIGAGIDALGGNFSAAYANVSADQVITGASADSDEFDLAYAVNLTDSFGLSAAYVYYDADDMDDSVNLIRLIANYNF